MTPTSLEQLALVVWLGLATAAGTDIIRISNLSYFTTGNNDKRRRAFVAICVIHIVTTMVFGLAAWVNWSESFRTEYHLQNRYTERTGDVLSEPLILSSWILAIISLILVWLVPTFLYVARWARSKVAWFVLGFTVAASVTGTNVVFFIIDAVEEGLLALPLTIWIWVLLIVGLFSTVFFEGDQRTANKAYRNMDGKD